ncbi:hypothetical protein C0J52_19470 [Blattella germanica]|nr:hypothetical protein C0J52_19470 [Blattella germanica]
MATCFGPPPLPPKRASNDSRRQSLTSANRKNRNLSSTYRSFRDPSEEDEIIVVASEDLEVASITSRTSTSFSSMTNSLSRKSSTSTTLTPLSLLSRSHSDGNLTNCTRRGSNATSSSGSGNFNTASGTLNRCLRALGSSWKNLLQLSTVDLYVIFKDIVDKRDLVSY